MKGYCYLFVCAAPALVSAAAWAGAPPAACCIDDVCETLSGADCNTAGGEYQGQDVSCSTDPCPEIGTCCTLGSCIDVNSEDECEALDGEMYIEGALCSEAVCDGACCVMDVIDETCFDDGAPEECIEVGGVYAGVATTCEDVFCFERAHPGWNHVSAEITLTKNEPAYWSAYSGQAKGLPPFTVLDPGFPPGRPDPEGSGDRVLRGYVLGWAVNTNNQEIRWNHLKGDAVIVNYENPSAWEYNAWAFPVVADVAQGEQSGDPGVLNMDGLEYAPGFDMLLLDFYASGARPFSPGEIGCGPIVETDLTLHPIATDLRQEDDGPVTTKAKVDVWNEDEVKFNGMERCITCWDQTLLSNFAAFGIPNNFLYTTLGTNKGKARIDGVRSDNCDFDFEFDPLVPFGADPRDIVSEDASILGVAAKHISFGILCAAGVAETDDLGSVAAAGFNLFGLGTESAVVSYDTLDAPPESAGTGVIRGDRGSSRRGRLGLPTEGVASTVDRVSATEKGSLLIWSKVEIRWDETTTLIQDTFIDITNDFGEDVMVQMYFINGDAPLEAVAPVIR